MGVRVVIAATVQFKVEALQGLFLHGQVLVAAEYILQAFQCADQWVQCLFREQVLEELQQIAGLLSGLAQAMQGLGWGMLVDVAAVLDDVFEFPAQPFGGKGLDRCGGMF